MKTNLIVIKNMMRMKKVECMKYYTFFNEKFIYDYISKKESIKDV
jgi:hypothetical protein